MTDDLGDRMKTYERMETTAKFMPLLPIYARLDGRGFSRFTKGFDRPFDARFRQLMTDTCAFLVHETNARIGYTQSDEISLCWLAERYDSGVFFDGKKQKMVSQLAALATMKFNQLLWSSGDEFLRQRAMCGPTFDARVFQLPSKTECVNAFVWREQDASKNALSMAAREYYSHKELLGKNGADMNEMLFRKGINFNDYPANFKRGSYVQRQKVEITLDEKQLMAIPEKMRPPNGVMVRSRVQVLDLLPLTKIVNRIEVVFEGAKPLMDGDGGVS